jgi:hypothetical protein
MSGFKTGILPWLINDTGRPVGVKEPDGDETMIPVFSPDGQSLLRADGSALEGTGAGYVLPVATAGVLGGVKAGTGVTIAADGTLSASGGGGGSAGPVALTTTTFEAIGAGKLVYVRADGQLALASSTAEGKEAIGFTLAAAASGAQATWYNTGVITGLSSLTPGTAYFMSPAGAIGAAPTTTGNVVLRVGIALTATTLLFEANTPITL